MGRISGPIVVALALSLQALAAAVSKNRGLHSLAKRAGLLYFGTATDNPELVDQPYVKILTDNKMFGQITPANSMKWESTEKSRGVFTFEGGNTIVNLGKENRQIVRGHNCLWHTQLPDWVAVEGFDKATMNSIIATHCSTLVKHWKGQIYSWDVINEPLEEDGTFRQTVFYNTTGTSYITTALRAARKADPRTKLYLNDYNLEFLGPKVQGMAALAKSLLSQGVPLDGIGFQGHLEVGLVPSKDDLVKALRIITDLGLEVAYTEVDVRMKLPVTPEKLAQQKADYKAVIESCVEVEKCVGVTLWDFSDKYSWVPGVFTGQGAPCPWNETMAKKPAYYGIAEAFL